MYFRISSPYAEFFLKFIASRCKRDISRKEKENEKEDFFKLATEVFSMRLCTSR